MLNIFILEDKWIEQANLEKHLHQIEKEINWLPFNIHSYSSSDKLINNLPLPSNHNVYLLDIEISDNKKAGLVLAKLLRKNDPTASIIFITVHDEFLPITYHYRVEALDFIAKENDNIYDRLLEDFKIIINKTRQQPSVKVKLKNSSGYIYLDASNILYFTPNPNNSHQSLLHALNNKIITVSGTLSEIEKESPLFYRVHRHYLINCTRVLEINTHQHTVTLAGLDQAVPLSRLHSQGLINHIEKLQTKQD